jgi:hypothetical protein
MATQSATPSSKTPPDDGPDPRPGSGSNGQPNGPRGDEPTIELTAHARTIAAETTESVAALLRHSQDATARWTQTWTESMLRFNPLTMLSVARRGLTAAGRDDPGLEPLLRGTRAWAETGFDIAVAALATQRRYVDQALTVQRQLLGQVLDTSAGLAAATRTAPADATEPRPGTRARQATR